jgi:hypothetical protein
MHRRYVESSLQEWYEMWDGDVGKKDDAERNGVFEDWER